MRRMHPIFSSLLDITPIALAATACNHEHPQIDVVDTETGGVITLLPTGASGGEEGADVTGGGEG